MKLMSFLNDTNTTNVSNFDTCRFLWRYSAARLFSFFHFFVQSNKWLLIVFFFFLIQ